MRGEIDQITAIVDLFDPYPGRQYIRAIDLIHFGFDPPDRRHALLSAAHQHNAFNHIVVIVMPAFNTLSKVG